MWDSRNLLERYMNLILKPKFLTHCFSQPEADKEEASRGGNSVVRDPAQEPGGALGQDGHLRGRRQGKEADW